MDVTKTKEWSILYRGPLSSCNYDCAYCPFAKQRNSTEELRDDAEKLGRFVDWVSGRNEIIGVLFTPWGEALPHRAYQEALVRLSWMENVRRVAIQTNLSVSLDWLKQTRAERVGIWATYHPTQTTRVRFLEQCQKLDEMGVRYSVGVVGLKEQIPEIHELRKELREDRYLWVNAYKDQESYYDDEELTELMQIDPLFPINALDHPSQGKRCAAGETSFTVDGEGDVRRCHFIAGVLGNIYEPKFEEALKQRLCTKAQCGCHIGYIYLEELGQRAVYGEGMLERIPAGPIRRLDIKKN